MTFVYVMMRKFAGDRFRCKILAWVSMIVIVVLTCLALMLHIAVPIQYTISIALQEKPAHRLDERFLSFGIDTQLIENSKLGRYLSSPRLRHLTSLLAPAHLRLGGTLADRLIFVRQLNVSAKKFLPFFVMDADDWRGLNEFCTQVGVRLLFDLNVLMRSDESWNTANAETLFEYTKQLDLGNNIDWQLGNEPNSFPHVFNVTIAPEQLSKDFTTLKMLLLKYFRRPKLIGPDTTRPQPKRPECVRYMKQFLSSFYSVHDDDHSGGPSHYLDAIAWHQYYLSGYTATIDDFWNPSTFDLLNTQIDTMKQNIHKYRDGLPMWLTETSSAYGGGAPGLSNSFAGSPLWLDKLGVAASNGIDVVIRQSLIGGNYSMISDDLQPLPDWWISYIYKQLVDGRVIRCDVTATRYQRVYCHCARNNERKSSVVIYAINLSEQPAVFTISGSAINENVNIDSYELTASSDERLSQHINLNGDILKYDGSDPIILPKKLNSSLVEMSRYSLAFWVVHNTTLEFCA